MFKGDFFIANEELKKKIIDELIELKPDNVSTQFLTSKFKIGYSLAEEIKENINS